MLVFTFVKRKVRKCKILWYTFVIHYCFKFITSCQEFIMMIMLR